MRQSGLGHYFVKRFDRFNDIELGIKQQYGKLVAKYARAGAEMMRDIAPVSAVDEANYQHFRDRFEAVKRAPFMWDIINDKIVNGYALWELLEDGTRHMAPQKTIGPVMSIVGPEFLREAAKFLRDAR